MKPIRIALAVGLLVDAVAAYFVLRDVFAGTDAALELVTATAIAILIAALAVAILIHPHRYLLAAASGIALLGILLVAGFGALLLIFAQGDLYNRVQRPDIVWSIAGAIAFQLVIWIAAWKVGGLHFGDALASSVAGAVGVLLGGTVAAFIIRFVASFFL